MSYGCSMYANKATPPVVENRVVSVEAKKILDTEDAVVTAIENGAETVEDVIAYVMNNVTDYDVTVVKDLYDEFCATIATKYEGF